VESKPLSIGAFQELGAVYNGLYSTGEAPKILDREWVDHFGAYLIKEVVINNRLHLSGGLGGVFQFRKPETVGAGFDFHQRKAFFIGPTRTEAVYHFGEDPESPWLKLGAGMFPYKYNPEASNLGEYLFRSRAYPTFMTTGGYVFANSTAVTLQGLKANFQRGGLKADVLLVTETELAPFYDWSLALVGSWSVAGGLLNLGAGVNFLHLIPVKPSRTSNPVRANSYFTDPTTGKKYTGHEDYYLAQLSFYQAKGDTVRAAQAQADYDVSDSLWRLPDGRRPTIHHYTTQAVLLMFRTTVDPKKLVSLPKLGAEDLKVYFEVDVLGVRNHPVFYKRIRERTPIMGGFNVPTFRVLDLLSVQIEYFDSPWLNNSYSIGAGNQERVVNTPFIPKASDAILSRNTYNDQAERDNWKWSVLARKTVANRLTLSAQVARDHLRMPSSQFYYGPQYEPNEITAFPDSWYWTTQISWGL
jgi:hypothetical protein